MELLVANAGRVREVLERGVKYLVAPATILVGGAVLDKTGVYKIRNVVNGKYYIGSAAVSFRSRWRDHSRFLDNGWHNNKHLQASWEKHGADSFEFSVLELCSPEDCTEVEQKHLDAAFTSGDRIYNICPRVGTRLGAKLSLESCKRNGDRFRGKPLSEQQRRNISLAQTGMKRSPQACVNIKAAQSSPEARAKMREILARPEIKEKMRQVQLGKRHTPEARMRMSVAKKGIPITAEHRANIAKGTLGHTVSEETRRKISETLKRRRVA